MGLSELLLGSPQKTKAVSNLNDIQRAVLPLLIAQFLDIKPSEVGNSTIIKSMMKEGKFDDLDLFKDPLEGFPGNQVAPLTDTQQNILGKVGGLAERVNQPLPEHLRQSFNTLFEGQGLAPIPQATNPLSTGQNDFNSFIAGDTQSLVGGGELVGEDGPEIITATEDTQIIPNTGPDWHTSDMGMGMDNMMNRGSTNPLIVDQAGNAVEDTTPSFTPLNAEPNISSLMRQPGEGISQGGETIYPPLNNSTVIEQNQIAADPDVLLAESGLPGRATGGKLQAGDSAVVGELGPEIATATKSALSGTPSSTVNTDTTQNFIDKSIANPLRSNFQENTLQQIKSSFAGPGYWGSARAGAEVKGASGVENQIGALGAQYSYADEQARRNLSESAANRSAAAIPTALNVSNNPLVQGQMRANIAGTQAGTASTQFGTKRGEALLPGEVAGQTAGIAGIEAGTESTKAGTTATEFGTKRGETLLGGEVGQQTANIAGTQAGTAATEFSTEAGQALLPGQIEKINADIAATLTNTALTAEQIPLATQALQNAIATGAQIDANTKATLMNMGLTEANIAQVNENILAGSELRGEKAMFDDDGHLIKPATGQLGLQDANLALKRAELLGNSISIQEATLAVVSAQITALGNAMELANIPQDQQQDVNDAQLADWATISAANREDLNLILGFLGESQQSLIVTPGTQGIAGDLIGAAGAVVGGAIG